MTLAPTHREAKASASDAVTILARLWCLAEGNNPDDTISDAGHTVLDGTLAGLDRKALAAIREAEQAIRAAMTLPERQPIASAPLNREVYVYCGEMRFRAKLVPGAAMYEAENGELNACDQWQATRDGEHPPCWSEGGCWASNADEIASLQPTHWSPVEPALTPTQER